MKEKGIHFLMAEQLCTRLEAVASSFGDDFDAISIISPLIPGVEIALRGAIEKKKASTSKNVSIILGTSGGVAEVVEQMVKIIRYHYQEVFFIIPDAAMSAGTIFALSGDKIYMDYYSCLGPIDPQVLKDGKSVSVTGYLRQFEDIKLKSMSEGISPVEFALLNKLDFGELEFYSEAEKLAKDLLVSWLPKYKFKDWDVQDTKKKARADEIAKKLGDNRHWHSHGRPIGIEKLREMKLRIDDFGENDSLNSAIVSYFSLMTSYMRDFKLQGIIQLKDYFDY